MDLLLTKVCVAVLSGTIRFIFGIIPLKIYKLMLIWEKNEKGPFMNEKRHKQVQCAVIQFQSFSGGVLFATCFLHMMPDVFVSVEELRTYTNSSSEYPLSQLIVCFGFLFIYFIEEGSHWLITKIPEKPVVCRKNGHVILKSATPNKNKVSPTNDELKNGSAFTIESAMVAEKNKINSLDIQDEDMGIGNPFIEDTISLESYDKKSVEEKEAVSSDSEDNELTEIIEQDILTQQHIFRGILTILALSLHSILEGLSIGLQSSVSNIWYLFIAVSIHSATILFCVGSELLLSKTRPKVIIIHILVLSITSPLGIAIGLLVTLNYSADSKAKSLAIIFLEGLSAGTILYITFFEILNREKERRVFRMRRALCIIGGFLLMAILQTL